MMAGRHDREARHPIPILMAKCICGAAEFELKKFNKHFKPSAGSGGGELHLHSSMVGCSEDEFKEMYFMGAQCPICDKSLSINSIYLHFQTHNFDGISEEEGQTAFTLNVNIFNRKTKEMVPVMTESDSSDSSNSSSRSSSRSNSRRSSSSNNSSSPDQEQLKDRPPLKKLKLESEGAPSNVKVIEHKELSDILVEMGFPVEEAQMAADHCTNVQSALVFLHQICQICLDTYPINQMISMMTCNHRCCLECTKTYFTIAVRERLITDMVCPICSEPADLLSHSDKDENFTYFILLESTLKNILDDEVFILFQQKLRDHALSKDKRFLWCKKAGCNSGYISTEGTVKATCPSCLHVTCTNCTMPWLKEHENMTCNEFKTWMKRENTAAEKTRDSFDLTSGEYITCPSCDGKFSLSRGGCIHFVCTFCRHSFCGWCSEVFQKDSECNFSSECSRFGLHAHHHKNCFFYLRDKDPAELEELLRSELVPFEAETEEPPGGKCQISIQRELPARGLIDDQCGADVVKGHELCRAHYIERLCTIIRDNNVDPTIIMTVAELEATLVRYGKRLPPRSLPIEEYQKELKQRVAELPLKQLNQPQ
ncbi:E3 ubiquitin-protein ligase lubel-like [Neocloeon triangulifer]|uniref:E3 ubiquitin-protein ligase lubel-like n=1 Tax=Neocloeon triangulifer TaxID=2078957 RepID=UPI00286F9C5E|nr:E3 ubiquitin-protein ligase lubel-like [Neocloeon triangulifer]XP_059477862.1 E3 ubiquitin-protein ligase lubel-like [Neocloeon triangulifer]XP_059477863.1 E3 ubiquitin-protein ligase lubel-like [Neocloeon triangulifer]XP_059477864.1 E3 ubiquitin-protein ligase lubel-like [Neocloeon triangulifer]XP_059477865.1 E3 ubiquitin-protein ligase lubel-like [Neocloeon triangulifer]XP_059477866.1 E3 ubiquitin-protein ligase lubel-like [Neocloeon triangulifer]XP_059477867.1 E3 ubiquitin-protein ligas